MKASIHGWIPHGETTKGVVRDITSRLKGQDYVLFNKKDAAEQGGGRKPKYVHVTVMVTQVEPPKPRKRSSR